MLGFLGALVLGAGLAGSSFNTMAQFNQHRRNAREAGLKIFQSKDKKGYGTFATDTGKRVWYDPDTDEWKEILSNRVVCASKNPKRLPQPGSREYKRREKEYHRKRTEKNKKEAIEFGFPTYTESVFGDSNRERLISNDLVVKRGHVRETYIDAKYGFGVYFNENNLKPQWHNGKIVEDKKEIHEMYVEWNMTEFLTHLAPLDCYDHKEGQEKIDEMLAFCKEYDVELDYDEIKKAVEKSGFIYGV